MASPDLTKEDNIAAYVSQLTGQECTSVEPISDGGSSAFVYRVTFAGPLEQQHNASTAIVKHFEDYAARAFNIKIDATRGDYEGRAMVAISEARNGSSSSPTAQAVQIPRLIASDTQTHTLLMQDVGRIPTLKAWLSSTTPLHQVRHVGTSLAEYLADIHARPLSAYAALGDNIVGRTLSGSYYYGGLPGAAARAGYEDHDGVLAAAAAESQREVMEAAEVFTMGDFWTGNILVDDRMGEGPAGTTDVKLWAVDFELAKPGTPEFDVGQMAAEMECLARFRDRERGEVLLESFLAGYKRLRKVDAAKVAIRVGTHHVMIGPMAWTAVAGEDRMRELVKEGIELVRMGWLRDEKALRLSVVKHLY